MASAPPISTIYVQNLEERVKLEPLTEALKSLFSEFGTVVDIVAKKNVRAKGQAFIVFDGPNDAGIAIDEMQGFELFGKSMKLSMARTRSDKTVEAKCNEDELEVHKRHRQAEKGVLLDKRRALEAADGQRNLKRGAPAGSETRPAKLPRPSGLKSTGATASNVIPDEYLPPNRTLFLQNIPDEYDVEALAAIFGRFDGLREIRLVPGRRGIAFVEYEAEQGAITAKENTAGMTLGDKAIKVTYQRE
ncbi:U1 small nuclear ribonucleoprotein [Tolypocladium ophioglossoides CBS 100239]|uniref:U1 small nuclear ribonucleoprotein n=1 Tax=Tolypocladium ophioglossoides (strain CBS 100239) TaxID=1163406 RepID=A0A0L0NBY9_TOLOC|nr:U1 small nuclear ribonucleoprotein [Tolypocladium ophioglossoides CBS 100239]